MEQAWQHIWNKIPKLDAHLRVGFGKEVCWTACFTTWQGGVALGGCQGWQQDQEDDLEEGDGEDDAACPVPSLPGLSM